MSDYEDTEALIDAYELLTDAGVPSAEAAKLSIGARRTGKNPREFAEHFLVLRQAVKEERA